MTASIGIAIFPEDGNDVDTLVKASEIAMYRAKELGRNNVQLYTPALNARSVHLLSLESSLRRALEKSEFRLVYQGKIDLSDGTLCGVEALIRWDDPEHGTVSPADFIPLAESLGLISDIGMWVLLEACRQVSEWRASGLPSIPISVNVSPRQFRDQNVARLVSRILKKYNVSPVILELEITESLLMQHFDDAAKTLADLRAIGVRVSIDDFGTGYSSLSYLSRIPIDSLKIDRSFIANISRSADDDEIVSSIIGLAHNLNLLAVAEGVETIEQAIFLNKRGCDQIQGYLVARPMTPQDFVALFHRKLLMIPEKSI